MDTKEKQDSLKSQLNDLKREENKLLVQINTNRKTQILIKREMWYLKHDIRPDDDIVFIEKGAHKPSKGKLIKLDADRSAIIFPIVRLYDRKNNLLHRERILDMDEQKTLKKA